MTEINKKLLYTLEDRFDKLQAYLDRVYQFEENEDLYSFIAHIMYNKDIDECREMNPDGTPNPDGKKLRDRAKQFILPVVVECGGISESDVKPECCRSCEFSADCNFDSEECEE